MQKLLLPFLALLFFTSCEKETMTDLQPDQEHYENGSVTFRSPAPKIDVCHYDAEYNTWHVINISKNAWPDHEGHGDVRLDDQDDDGYVPDNVCNYGQQGDCDDTNAAINPGAEEVCGDNIDNDCDNLIDEDCGCPEIQGLLLVTLPDGSCMYVHPTNNSTGIPWSVYNTDILGLANITTLDAANADFAGEANTQTIVNALDGGTYAAKLCADLVYNGYDDWYLPAAGELNAMYQQLGPTTNGFNGSGDMQNGIYLSSTEYSGFNAWVQAFDDGFQGLVNKPSLIYQCRCVRR